MEQDLQEIHLIINHLYKESNKLIGHNTVHVFEGGSKGDIGWSICNSEENVITTQQVMLYNIILKNNLWGYKAKSQKVKKKKKSPKKGKGKGCRLKRGGPLTTQGIVLTAAVFVKWLRTSLTLYVFSCSTTFDKTSSCWKMFRNLQFFFWYIVYLFFDICYFSTAFFYFPHCVCACV